MGDCVNVRICIGSCGGYKLMIVSTLIIPLTNGGTGGAIFVFLGTAVGMGFVIASMAEMASMAPTSGGQYHWVSEFAPREHQRFLSYVVGQYHALRIDTI